MKSFQAEDQSTLSMATDLENFINDAGVSLEELVQDIDSQILCLREQNLILDVQIEAHKENSQTIIDIILNLNECWSKKPSNVKIIFPESTNEIQDDASVTVAKLLENKFNAFISAINAKAKMSPGEMLVLGINKLYSAASNAFIDYRRVQLTGVLIIHHFDQNDYFSGILYKRRTLWLKKQCLTKWPWLVALYL